MVKMSTVWLVLNKATGLKNLFWKNYQILVRSNKNGSFKLLYIWKQRDQWFFVYKGAIYLQSEVWDNYNYSVRVGKG